MIIIELGNYLIMKYAPRFETKVVALVGLVGLIRARIADRIRLPRAHIARRRMRSAGERSRISSRTLTSVCRRCVAAETTAKAAGLVHVGVVGAIIAESIAHRSAKTLLLTESAVVVP